MNKHKPSTTEAPAREASAPDLIAVGSAVLYLGVPATIITVHDQMTVDLLYVTEEGRRRIADRVPRGLEYSQWATRVDLERARPRTPMELWVEARDRGERVVEVAMIVVYAHDFIDMRWHDVRPVRARVTKVFSLDEVALEELGPEPLEPDDPETVTGMVARAAHARTANENQRKLFFEGMWTFVGEELIVPSGRISHTSIFPPCRCPVCGAGAQALHLLPLGPDPEGVVGEQVVRACSACLAKVRSALAPPAAALLKATHAGYL